jgi:hypothetical protein
MPINVGLLSAASSLKNPASAALLGYRINYIKNPSFSIDTTDWVGGAGATIQRVTYDGQSGNSCLEVTNASASFAAAESRIPLPSSGSVFVSAYVKLPELNVDANYYIRVLQYETEISTSTVAAGNIGVRTLSPTGSWVRLSGTFNKSAIANWFALRIVTSSASNGEKFLVDSVMVERSTSLRPYFDGDNNGFWTGEAGNSYSGASPY